MVRLALLAPVLALLGGCIIYDTKCPDCGWDDDSGRPDRPGDDDDGDDGDDTASDDTDGDTADVVENAFVLDPSEATAGESFIGSLTAVDVFDYGTVEEIEVFGDVTLTAASVRDDEILLSLVVDADGAGTADFLVHLADGSVEFVEAALTIVPADGSGDGTDGSGDGTDGSGDGTDGSGDGSSGTSGSDGGSDDCP